MEYTDNKEHSRKGGCATHGKLEETKRTHKANEEIEFVLVQDESGEWYLQFAGSENKFPATDVEVALWKKLHGIN